MVCEWFARPLANHFASGAREHSQIILRVVCETTRKLFCEWFARPLANYFASGSVSVFAPRERRRSDHQTRRERPWRKRFASGQTTRKIKANHSQTTRKFITRPLAKCARPLANANVSSKTRRESSRKPLANDFQNHSQNFANHSQEPLANYSQRATQTTRKFAQTTRKPRNPLLGCSSPTTCKYFASGLRDYS